MSRRTSALAALAAGFREARRDAALVPRADYDAAKDSRFRRRRTGIDWAGSGADYHVRNEGDYWRLVETFRDMERNDPIVGQGIKRLVDNTIQGGFTLDVDTGTDDASKAFDARAKELWLQWATDPERCSRDGRHDFLSLQRLVLRRMTVDGDVLVNLTDDGFVQTLEAHRLRTPTGKQKSVAGVVHGVERDARDRHVRYFVTKAESAGWTAPPNLKDYIPLAARDPYGFAVALLVQDPQRLSQTRGVSAMAPIADVAGMHADLNFAKLVQAQIASCIGFIRVRDPNAPATPAPQVGTQTTETQADGSSRILEELAPGLVLNCAPGEELKPFAPNVTSSEHLAFALSLLQLISVNIGLPIAVLLLDPSQTNFSGWRGAIDQARLGFSAQQQNLIVRLHTPLYRWRLAKFLREDRILAKLAAPLEADGRDLFRHAWHPPQWRYIQPIDDATADVIKLGNALSPPRRVHAERGVEWSDLFMETIADRRAAIEAAIRAADEINRANPDAGVHWRELMPLPSQDGIKFVVQSSPVGEPAVATPVRKEAAA